MLIGLLAEEGLFDAAVSCASPPQGERMLPSQSPEAGLFSGVLAEVGLFSGVLAAGAGDDSDENQSPIIFSFSLDFPFWIGV